MRIAAMTSSFTAFAFAPGALNTGTPRFESAATGTLFVPAPARPTAFTLFGIVIACMSAERTMIASGSALSDDTAYLSRGNRSSPRGEMLLSVRIVNRAEVDIRCRLGVAGRDQSSVFPLEVAHEAHKCFDTFHRHRVVEARAHSTDRPMPLEGDEAGVLRVGDEGLVELGLREREDDVHPRPRVRLDRIL